MNPAMHRLVTLSLAGALVGGVAVSAGCSCSSPEPAAEEAAETSTSESGLVAASVRDTKIYEDDITAEIQAMREENGLMEDDAWTAFLDSMGYEPSTLRDQALTRRIDEELVAQEAASRGLTLSDEELTAAFESERALYDSDEQWNAFLDARNWTQESYRETLRRSLEQERLEQQLVAATISDEDRLAQAQLFAEGYNGAKRVSRIVLGAGDSGLAASLKERIASGEITFAQAAAEYSLDTVSAANGGDAGWDVLAAGSFPREVFATIATMNPGELSDPVATSTGIELVTVTDVFQSPEEITSIEQLPEEFRAAIDKALAGVSGADALASWLAEQKASGDIVKIWPIPEDIPYARP